MPARLLCSVLIIVLAFCGALPAAEKNTAYQAALESIVAREMGRTVNDLAGPKFEGREAGSTGGRYAGEYLADELHKLRLEPAGENRDYFQPFRGNLRNVLALLPGSDPEAKGQFVIAGAHYDHVGRGRRRDTNPPGPIYPGADDNASGTAGVLELARAFSAMPVAPRRSILFMFFDGEEKGLLGSRHWTSQPTVPLENVVLMANFDMIGALRAERLYVFGSRSGAGLRRLICDRNQDSGLTLDFPWALRPNADYYPFYDRKIPVFFFHTGLHERYHQPTDQADKINTVGMEQVTRLAFAALYEVANCPQRMPYRAVAKSETEDGRRRLEAAESAKLEPGEAPLRMGIAWRVDEAELNTVIVSHIFPNSPAATAGLKVGDRIYRISGHDFADDAVFARLARKLPSPLELLVERDGKYRTVVLRTDGKSEPQRKI